MLSLFGALLLAALSAEYYASGSNSSSFFPCCCALLFALPARICALDWAPLWPYAMCLVLFRRHVRKAGLVVLGLSMLEFCEAVCPTCFGSLPSCAFATCGKCAIEVQVAANTAIIVSGAAAGLSLATILKPRWMRIFHLSSINAICALAQRKPPGTVFEHTGTTSLTDVASAVANGQYSLDLAVLKYAELLDKCDLTTTAGKTAADRLERDLKNLSMMARTGAMSAAAAHSTRDQGGVYSFLWARISEYVPKRGGDDKVTIATTTADGASSTSATCKSVYSATLVRAKDLLSFAETMNLFVMFATSLGLVSTVDAPTGGSVH